MSHITCQHRDKTLGNSIKHPTKRKRHVDDVLLYPELSLNLNRHIWHGRAVTNIGLWSRVQKIKQALEKRRNVLGCLGLLKKDRNRNSCFETCRISHIGHILGRLKWVCIVTESRAATELSSKWLAVGKRKGSCDVRLLHGALDGGWWAGEVSASHGTK